MDPAGNAYIAGNAGMGLSTTPGALLTNGIGAFVAKVNSAGTALVYVTYLGAGSLEPTVGTLATDFVTAIAADGAGHAYLAGSTSDLAFPATAGAFQTALAGQVAPPFVGPPDAFVAKLNPTGSAMVWATFLGGSGNDQAQTIAVDSAGDVWVSGITRSTDFPSKVSVTSNGSEFLAELNSTGSALSYSALFPSDTVAAALAVDADGTVHVGGATGPISAFSPGSAPGLTSAPWMFGIANAAGGVLSGRLAPGELISIYGLHLGPSAPVSATFNAAGFLPTTLGGVQQPRIGRQPRPFAAAARIAAVTAGAVAGEDYWAGVGGQQWREKQSDSQPHHLNRQPPRANRTPPSRPSTVSTHPHSDKSCDPSGSMRTRYSRGASVPVPYAPGRTR